MERLGNERKYIKAEYQILSVFVSTDSSMGFSQLQMKASVSSKTLAKHLKTFVPRIVQKRCGEYCITDEGRRHVENIERELDAWRKGKEDRLLSEMVEVYSIGPNYFCQGKLTVSSPRRFRLEERARLDEAITHAIRTLESIIPESSKNWRVSINWHGRSEQ